MIIRVLFLLFLSFHAKLYAATGNIYPGSDYTFSVSDIDDKNKIPGEWIDLGEISLPTYSELTMNSTAYEGAACMQKFCVGGTVHANSSNRVNIKVVLNITHKEWTDDQNRKWELSVAWPNAGAVIEIGDYNDKSGRHYYRQIDVVVPLSPGSGTYGISVYDGKSDTMCGTPVGGCNMSASAYFKNTSSKPHLYLKVPSNVSQSSIDFSSLNLKDLMWIDFSVYNNAGSDRSNDSRYAYPTSGSFSIPQRCTISLDKSKLFFTSIKRGDNNGLQSTQSTKITTVCNRVPSNTKQLISVVPVDGGKIEKNIYVTHDDSSGNPALGFVYSLGSTTPDCNNGNQFNSSSLLRMLSGNTDERYEDTINFGLCKYSLPLTYGTFSSTIKIVTRWETP